MLALEDKDSDARGRIEAEIEAAKHHDRAEAIVLGCAGMADLAAKLSVRHGLPVVDGVVAAVMLVESLARLGLRTSKQGGLRRAPREGHPGIPDRPAAPS